MMTRTKGAGGSVVHIPETVRKQLLETRGKTSVQRQNGG